MTKTQIRGAPRIGASAMDEGDTTRAVVAAYSRLTQAEARDAGQAAAEAAAAARRELWAVVERLAPRRLAAALRARLDPEGDSGLPKPLNDLRRAIADWLDPPPVCRRCGRAMRDVDEGAAPRVCSAVRKPARGSRPERTAPVIDPESGDLAERVVSAARRAWTPRPVVCRPSRTRRAPGAVERCGTLALYPAGLVSLDVMAAALACPKGAGRSYDVAADRDGRALTAAALAAPPRDPLDEGAWVDDQLRRVHEAVSLSGEPTVPPQVAPLLSKWRRLRDAHAVANGRAILGVQVRYGVPGGGVCRADLIQGAAMGNDRAAMDYDPTQARYTTYGAAWIRQGVGEARSDRDLVGTPEWLASLRGALEDRLPGVSRADLLRAVEAVCEAVAPDAPASIRARAPGLAADLVRLLLDAEVRENLPGTRPARYIRRALFADRSDDAVASAAAQAIRAAIGKVKRKAKVALVMKSGVLPAWTVEGAPANAFAGDEDPERARERLAGWIARRLQIARATGSGLLSALRHSAPVFVQVGAGGDEDDDAQGTDGAGGTERQAAVLAAPDDLEREEAERLAKDRWAAALQALAAVRLGEGLRSDVRGAECAEVVRRHHGLDSVAEDRGGATGESFGSIASGPLVCSGRTLSRQAICKIYNRGIAALRAIIAGGRPDLSGDADDLDDDADDPSPIRVPRSPFKPLPPPVTLRAVSNATAPPHRPNVDDGGAWAVWREQAASVSW